MPCRAAANALGRAGLVSHQKASRPPMTDTPSSARPLPDAHLPRGFADRDAVDVAATETMLAKIRSIYELYGFDVLETPFIEFTEALGKFLPDQDRPNEGVFSFKDDDDQWLSLRYDLTAPLARHVAEHYDKLPKPYRSMRAGWVFRNEKPGPGRFRQFMQCDADIVGAGSIAADAEVAMLMADTLEAVGIARGDYLIKVNNRKVLDGMMEAIGLGGDVEAARRLTVLRAIDKLDKFPADEIRKLLGAGRKDESGDFTKGAGLDAEAIERVIAFTGWGDGAPQGTINSAASLENFRKAVGTSQRGQDGIAELETMQSLFTAAGYDESRILIDPSVVRGLEYYTGPVFEAELTFAVKGDDGRPVRFGSVAGGGRYDGLVSRFRGETVPATGFSIGVSRLLSALRLLGKIEHDKTPAPVVVLVMDRDQIAHYQKLVTILRQNGLRAELYLGDAGMKAQMKYADRRHARCVVIQGSDERERGEVLIKDLVLGATLSSAPDREAYLKAQAEAQFAVSEALMVDAVRKVLARG
jgi:histidyl-tRNA synthetase